MTSRNGWRLLWIALFALALGVVAAAAYGLGANANHAGPFMVRRGFGTFGFGGGAWWGFLPGLLVVLGVVFLLLVLLTASASHPAQPVRPPWTPPMPPTPPTPTDPTDPTAPMTPTTPAVPSGATGGASDSLDVARLRELSELHDNRKLTDEEFAAAKRKLLGL